MRNRFAAFLFLAAATLAACGGGGGSTGITPPAPTSSPTAAPQGNLPLSESVGGSSAWVDPSTGGTCTGACLSVWPVFTPAANAQANGNMTIVTRSDGTGQQWAYQGHPLYTFSGDSGPDQTSGDNYPDFGGHWHIARPSSTSPTPAPSGGSTSPPCTGVYC
jgi:predicted lipoprotein with Yx(FWY)xxD motif